VREAIRTPMQEILRAISGTLEDTPPELAGDITREGILLAGGGTLLRGLPHLVTEHTGMTVSLAESPLTCVAIGSGLALDHFDQIATSALPRR
jgi:rod shape-determining protein MreB